MNTNTNSLYRVGVVEKGSALVYRRATDTHRERCLGMVKREELPRHNAHGGVDTPILWAVYRDHDQHVAAFPTRAEAVAWLGENS